MNNTHPIDHALAVLLIAFEGVCWIINELAGLHPARATREFWENVEEVERITSQTEIDDPRDTVAIEAPVLEIDDCSFIGGSHDLDWLESFSRLSIREPLDLASLKVTELRKQAKGLAKNVHMMRKAELVALLA